MIIKSILLTAILFFSSVVVVKAQLSLSGGAGVSEGQLSSDQATTQAVLGWNYVHATNCYTDGGTFFVFPAESNIIGSLSTTNAIFFLTLAPACQTGNYIAVFVTGVSGNSFSWNQIVTYSFK